MTLLDLNEVPPRETEDVLPDLNGVLPADPPQHLFYPFDLNIHLDEEQENLHAGTFCIKINQTSLSLSIFHHNHYP
jgi:hypothetical protein